MNSDIKLLECNNQHNLQPHKSRFVKCQIAGTISQWRKTDRANTTSIKTNHKTRNRGTCVFNLALPDLLVKDWLPGGFVFFGSINNSYHRCHSALFYFGVALRDLQHHECVEHMKIEMNAIC